MSAYTFRGNGDANAPATRSNGNGKAHRANATPLQRFVEAKNKINSIFSGVQQYVDEAVTFLKDVASVKNFVPATTITEAEQFRDSVKTIREVLSRDHMKVVFFGRTSNGKSTSINAMLHAKVLPSGIGHTTRCFVQVEGSEGTEKYIRTEDDETKSLATIDSLAHALCSQEFGEDTLVRIFWPKADSKLLQNEVVLVDSPGIDVSPQFDSWIDKHCLDADVFVLVANAESTLTQAEKNFFHRVSSKLSKPNVFILNNRWDASAAEPELIDQVRAQHTTRLVRFLVDELQVCNAEEAKYRVFFVSAREILQHRLKDKGITLTPSAAFLAEGYQARMLEFQEFERQFELCISQSAINTKFEAHIEKGKHVATSLHQILADLNGVVNDERAKLSKTYQDMLSQLRLSQSRMLQFITESKDKISQLSAEVQLKVSTEFTDEIRRLDAVMDGFQKPFSDDPSYLPAYKEELVDYIDHSLKNELAIRCTGGLLERIIGTEREMVGNVVNILPDNYTNKVGGVTQFREPFRFAFAIHCRSLLHDFREDLEFRFSLGLTQLIRRFIMLRSGSCPPSKEAMFGGGGMIPRPISTPEYEYAPTDFSHGEDAVMNSLVYTSASYVANGGVGLLLVGGLVYRTIGWRVLATGAAVYTLWYFYERLSWNGRAKEQTFKKQLRQHLALKLKQLSHAVTMNCDSQVTREVQEVLSRLQAVATECHQDMKVDVDKLQREVSELDKLTKDLAQTKGKATFLCSELDSFANAHLAKASNR